MEPPATAEVSLKVAPCSAQTKFTVARILNAKIQEFIHTGLLKALFLFIIKSSTRFSQDKSNLGFHLQLHREH